MRFLFVYGLHDKTDFFFADFIEVKKEKKFVPRMWISDHSFKNKILKIFNDPFG